MDKRLLQMGDRRDLYARFDLPARKGFLRKGAAGSLDQHVGSSQH
jgi:hypothetical protein